MKIEINWQPWEFYQDTNFRFFYTNEKGSVIIRILNRYDIAGSSPKIVVKNCLFTPVPMVEVPKPKKEYWLIECGKLCGILYDKKEADKWLTCFGRCLIEKERQER